jgi:hypothetical protein
LAMSTTMPLGSGVGNGVIMVSFLLVVLSTWP